MINLKLDFNRGAQREKIGTQDKIFHSRKAKIILLIGKAMLPDFEILLCHIYRASDDKIL